MNGRIIFKVYKINIAKLKIHIGDQETAGRLADITFFT